MPRTLLLLTALPALMAQAPATEVPLAQRLKAEKPEIEKLIEAFQPKEALAKAEALLPAQTPAWDKTDGNTQYKSYVNFQDYAQAYFLAYRAAFAAGQLEKAAGYVKHSQECMKANAENTAALFPGIVTAYQSRAQRSRDALKADESYIKDLKAKANPDAGEKQQLDLIAAEEKSIGENEKWAGVFQGFIDAAKKNATIYDDWVKAAEELVKAETTQIAEYKAGNGEKSKWVEAIISNPSYLQTNYPDKARRVAFLFRLNVLDPDNAKVLHQIDVELGKAAPEPVKPVHHKGKKKG